MFGFVFVEVCCVLCRLSPYSSVVEHPLSKRKVGSSILPGGKLLFPNPPQTYPLTSTFHKPRHLLKNTQKTPTNPPTHQTHTTYTSHPTHILPASSPPIASLPLPIDRVCFPRPVSLHASTLCFPRRLFLDTPHAYFDMHVPSHISNSTTDMLEHQANVDRDVLVCPSTSIRPSSVSVSRRLGVPWWTMNIGQSWSMFAVCFAK